MATPKKKKSLTAGEAARKAQKLLIARTLEDFSTGKLKPENKSVGICFNLSNAAGCNGYRIVRLRTKGWNGIEGASAHPVGGPYGRGNIWIGRYGALRKSLCAHVAKTLRGEIRKNNFAL